ncbi:MAG: response regulator transcription factor [Bacteroidota bacterium]
MNKVLFAEDHSIVIRGMKILFEREFSSYQLEVVQNRTDMMNALKTKHYELAIIDLYLDDGDTLHLISTLLKLYPQLTVLIFSGNPEELYAQKLYAEGVKGYLSKQTNDEEIVSALKQLLEGKRYMSENFKKFLLAKKNTPETSIDKLTQREMEVLNLMVQGKRSSEICKELNLQASTMATYKVKLFNKLQVTNIIELSMALELYKGAL